MIISFKFLYICVFALCFCLTAGSQTFEIKNYRGELNIAISAMDEKKLNRGIEMLNEAYSIESQAINKLELMNDDEKKRGVSSDYNKAVKLLLESSELYREGHELIEAVFHDNCDKFSAEMKKMNHHAAGMQKAKYYEMKAEINLKHAASLREIVQEADKPGWIQYKMAEAVEIEKLAIRDRGRALQIYHDFPVEYNYGWENDVTPEEVEAALGDPIINRPPEDLFVQKPKEEAEINDTVPEFIPIIFKVQIAAHTEPIGQDYLERIYEGDEPISESHTDMWYRYTIGEFQNFKDAEQLLQYSGVRRAFVVAFQGDKKLTIKKALALIKENQ